VTVLAELDTRTHRNILEAVADGVQLPAVADRLHIDIRVVRALASDAGFPDREAVRTALARLTRPPKPRPAPTAETDPEETEDPGVALATAFHGTRPGARPAFLANLADRAQLERLTVFLAAMLPAKVRLADIPRAAWALQLAVRSRDPQLIRAALNAHDVLSLCDLARDLADALPHHLNPSRALAWCEQDTPSVKKPANLFHEGRAALSR
jgi:hypothetical protein